MKHVFAVTSHLTFLLMDRIVEADGLNHDDVVLLLLRDYKIPAAYTERYTHTIATSYNIDVDKGRVFAGWRIGRTRMNIAMFDRKVDAVIGGEEFLWYSPVCSNDICSLMVTKDNCRGYYVTEDGLASYRTYNPQTFTGVRSLLYHLVLKPLWPRIFAVKNHFIETEHTKFRGCIASSTDCFPLHKQYVRAVGNPFSPLDTGFSPDAVISIDPLYQFIGHDKADEVYRRLAEYMQREHSYTTVAYKMHPRFNAADNSMHNEEYRGLVKKYFPDATEIAPGVVLENMLAWCKADFYSFNSSVAIYASQSGAHCYNILPLLKGTPAYEENWIINQRTTPVT